LSIDKLGLEISVIVFIGIFIFTIITISDPNNWKEARLIADVNWEKKIFTEEEKQMAVILIGQMELSNTDFSCDIDFLSRLHDKPICLSKSNVITLTDLGYIMHDYTKSSHMWFDSDGELVKLKGESGRATEYNGTVNKITIKGDNYYLITNPVFQGNYN